MIVVALKCVGGALSEPEAAALETALRLDPDVRVVTVGPVDTDPGLRQALAAGAGRAVRIDAPTGVRSDVVGRLLASALGDMAPGPDWVLCGDASPDRGSGSVPAFLADELGLGQALGLVAVEPHDAPNVEPGDDGACPPAGDAPGGRRSATDTRAHAALGDMDPAAVRPPVVGRLRLVRRLDGGRREVLLAGSPAVLSVEGAVARLRRAPLPATLAAQTAAIDVRPGWTASATAMAEGGEGPLDRPLAVRPYRPRPRQLAEPEGAAADRIRQLTATGAPARPSTTVRLEPAAAAAAIIEYLRAEGYLERPS